jgi:hypothetical protein
MSNALNTHEDEGVNFVNCEVKSAAPIIEGYNEIESPKFIDGISLQKGFRVIIENFDWCEISRIRIKRTDPSKACLNVIPEERK